MDSEHERRPDGPPHFDPVCGKTLWELTIEQFFDGNRIQVFCCAMCRRVYIDAWLDRVRLQDGGLTGTRATELDRLSGA
jgi:hypothetical protein